MSGFEVLCIDCDKVVLYCCSRVRRYSESVLMFGKWIWRDVMAEGKPRTNSKDTAEELCGNSLYAFRHDLSSNLFDAFGKQNFVIERMWR